LESPFGESDASKSEYSNYIFGNMDFLLGTVIFGE
jgi:hypothetical protein